MVDGRRALGGRDEGGPVAADRRTGHASDPECYPHGTGQARTSATPAGVNGLHDMGGNLWDWVDHPPGAAEADEHRMRGGSWWYGAEQMRGDWHPSKPGDTAVVYIGLRCARPR